MRASSLGLIIDLVIISYLFGWIPNRDYEEVTARTVSCSHFHEGRSLSASECFEYAKKHREEPYLVEIKERVFHVSFINQTVAEIGYFREATAHSCKVFDAENWICPIGLSVKDFDPNRVTDSSRIVMKEGDFEEWLNRATYPIKDIHLHERTTHYLGNWLEFKVLKLCWSFGGSCRPSYSIDSEDDYWL